MQSETKKTEKLFRMHRIDLSRIQPITGFGSTFERKSGKEGLSSVKLTFGWVQTHRLFQPTHILYIDPISSGQRNSLFVIANINTTTIFFNNNNNKVHY